MILPRAGAAINVHESIQFGANGSLPYAAGKMATKKNGARAGKKSKRGSKFTMLLSRDEQAQLHELAAHSGVPASVYLRMLIRNVHKDSLTELQDGRVARMDARRANGA
jgi:hypothetical protein